MVIRISKGRYAAELHSEVSARLNAAAVLLIPAIRKLPGCISYHAGADAATCTMVNVSVWDTLEHAQAMSSLREMAELAREFAALGVEFERPIANYAVLWQLPER
jgi:quinol monooxygenase YgiN